MASVSVHPVQRKTGVTWIVKRRDPDQGYRQITVGFSEAEYGAGAKHTAELFAIDSRTVDGRWPPGWARGGEDTNPLTVAEWFARWNAGRTGITERTRHEDQRRAELHILPSIGDRPLVDVTPDDVRDLMRLWGSAKPRSIEQRRVLLASMMLAAVDVGYRKDNPCKGIKGPRIERRELVILTPQEVDLLVGIPEREQDRAILRVLAMTGLRWGELAGLDGRHIDLIGRQLVVEQSYGKHGAGREWSLGPPKSANSRRRVPLATSVVEALLPHAGTGEHEPVFTGPDGERIAYAWFQDNVWTKTVGQARGLGLTKQPTLHSLRHFFASQLLAVGISLFDVSRRLGDTMKTVEQNYAHLVPGADDAVIAALDGLGRSPRPLDRTPTLPADPVPVHPS